MNLTMNLYLPIAGNSVNCLAIFGLGGGRTAVRHLRRRGGFLMTPC